MKHFYSIKEKLNLLSNYLEVDSYELEHESDIEGDIFYCGSNNTSYLVLTEDERKEKIIHSILHLSNNKRIARIIQLDRRVQRQILLSDSINKEELEEYIISIFASNYDDFSQEYLHELAVKREVINEDDYFNENIIKYYLGERDFETSFKESECRDLITYFIKEEFDNNLYEALISLEQLNIIDWYKALEIEIENVVDVGETYKSLLGKEIILKNDELFAYII